MYDLKIVIEPVRFQAPWDATEDRQAIGNFRIADCAYMSGEPVTVTCTAEDIAAGMRNEPTFCPIAIALARHGFRSVKVNDKMAVYASDKRQANMSGLPRRVSEAIKHYDRTGEMSPITFTIGKLD